MHTASSQWQVKHETTSVAHHRSRSGRWHPSRRPRTLAQAALQDNRLAEWLVQQGGTVAGVQLLDSGPTKGRVLVATQDHPAGACLVSAPSHLCLRYDTVTDRKLIQLFERVPTGSDSGGAAWQYKQALTLMWHHSQGASSPLHAYLQYLPGAAQGTGLPDVGMLLDEDVVDELQDVELIQDVINHKYWWQHFYEHELAPLAGTDTSPFGTMAIDKQVFGAAVAVVISRCFGLRRIKTHVMPPLIDMANHTLADHPSLDPPNCEVMSDQKTGAVNMFTTQPVKAGTQLLVCYGQHSNAELVLSYGFALPNNPNDQFLWRWDMEVLVAIIKSMCNAKWVQDPVPAWQITPLGCLGLSAPPLSAQAGQGEDHASGGPAPPLPAPAAQGEDLNLTSGGQEAVEKVVLGGSPPVDPRLLAAVRVLLCPLDARSRLEGTSVEDLCDWDKPLGHEVKVHKALSSVVTAIYQSFPTTIQQDKAILLQLQDTAAADLSSKQQPQDTASTTSSNTQRPQGTVAAAPSNTQQTQDTAATSREQQPPVAGTEAVQQQAHQRQLAMAVTFRLSMKLALEKALKDILLGNWQRRQQFHGYNPGP